MSQLGQATFVKKPNINQLYSSHQIQEIMKCADQITGPAYFLDNYFMIQHPIKGAIQYHAFDYQKELLKVYHNYKDSINLLSRQLGKSTTAAGYLLWYAMFNPDSTILIAAHKWSGASEIMQRIRYAYESCPDFIRAGVTEYSKRTMVFDNGSRIVASATTENTGRGMSLTLIYLDEFSFVRPSIAREFWSSISPTLSTGGKSIITSTPSSDEDQFAEIWNAANKTVDEYGNPTDVGINGYKAFKALWNEHPDRDKAWADKERAKIGDEKFDREHNCLFINIEETLIKAIKLATLESKEPIEKQGQIRWYKKPIKGKMYIVALDPSLGTGSDPAAIQVFESSPELIQVAEWQHNRTDIRGQVNVMKSVTETLVATTGEDKVYYSVENNTIGEATLMAIEEIGEENIKGIFLHEPKKLGAGKKYRKGFYTSHTSKLSACSKMKNLIEYDNIKIYSKNLISELKTFVASGNTFKAKIGDHDDLVLALMLVIRMLQALRDFYPELEQQMRDSSDEVITPLPFIVF